MTDNSVAEALRALAATGSKKSETARLRLVFDEVERAFEAGISRESMLETLHSQGFKMTLRGFDTTLYRLRKKRDSGVKGKQTSAPVAVAKATSPAGLTPKKEGEIPRAPTPGQGTAAPRRPGEPEKFVWDVDSNEKPEW